MGNAPGLLYGGCHAEDEAQVFLELCEIVEEVVELYRREGREAPAGDRRTGFCDADAGVA